MLDLLMLSNEEINKIIDICVNPCNITEGHDLIASLHKNAEVDTKGTLSPAYLYQNMIGFKEKMKTTLGKNEIVYADWTSSGKSLRVIEETIARTVLPFYANTHTETSITGRITSDYRDIARKVIQERVHAVLPLDVVLFTGTGCTGAIHKMIVALGIKPRHKNSTTVAKHKRPVVFISPFETNNNLAPWKESWVDIVRIQPSSTGSICEIDLINQLKQYSKRHLRIGSFSICSHLTGIVTDVDKISSILHKYKALSFWNFSAYGPFANINMNPSTYEGSSYKDALFISTHMLLGGPGGSEILVAKRSVFQGLDGVPTAAGGGTVVYSDDMSQFYKGDIEEREEAGTPDIVGCIRAGLTIYLHSLLQEEVKLKLEERNVEMVLLSLKSNKNIEIVGGMYTGRRIPIFSILIRWGKKFLHHEFVCTLLNDLYGIQSQGGCLDSGSFYLHLMGVRASDSAIDRMKREPSIHPGVTRISFPYFMPADDIRYTLKAIHTIANSGYMLLHYYSFDLQTGIWKKDNGRKVASKNEMEFRKDDELNWFALPSEVSKLSLCETKYYKPPAQCDLLNPSRRTDLTCVNRIEN